MPAAASCSATNVEVRYSLPLSSGLACKCRRTLRTSGSSWETELSRRCMKDCDEDAALVDIVARSRGYSEIDGSPAAILSPSWQTHGMVFAAILQRTLQKPAAPGLCLWHRPGAKFAKCRRTSPLS